MFLFKSPIITTTMHIHNKSVPRIAIFISGGGSLVPGFQEFEQQGKLKVAAVVASRECSGLSHFTDTQVPQLVAPKSDDKILSFLAKHRIDAIVLAGYMKILTADLIKHFNKPIINTHPSLLPKHGGHKMYGDAVHKAVIESKDKESGFTVHLVTPEVDEGPIIAQGSIELAPETTWEELKAEVQRLEKKYYPEIVHQFLTTPVNHHGCGCC